MYDVARHNIRDLSLLVELCGILVQPCDTNLFHYPLMEEEQKQSFMEEENLKSQK